MSAHAFGAMNGSIHLPAILRGFRPDLGGNFRDELMDCLPTLEYDALSLIDFVEA